METPEQDNFLETIRELRKEAEEKLTGNRHYLAIQKLDEIAEAVEQRSMSSEELGAVNEVLRGEHEVPLEPAEDATQISKETPPSPDGETPDLMVPAAAGAALAVGAAVSTDEQPVSEDASPVSENVNVLPNWWKGEEQEAVSPIEEPAVLEEPVVVEEPVIVEEAAPVETVIASEPVLEPQIEVVEEIVEERSPDFAHVAAGSALAGVAAAAVADQFSSEVAEPAAIETAPIVEEMDVIDVPEVEVDAPDVELPVINIAGSEQEVEVEDIAQVVEGEAAVDALPEMDLAADPEVQENVELEMPVVREEEPVLEVVSEEPELEMPELEAPVAEVGSMDAPAEMIVEEAVSDIIIEDVSEPAPNVIEGPEPDTTAHIADLLSDGDVDTQAVAAGAAAAAIGAAGMAMQGEATEPDVVEPQVTPAPEAPEKLSFPSAEIEQESGEAVPEDASPVPAAKILTGENIERHPTYGGNRGGVLKRFVNSLRGKDYI